MICIQDINILRCTFPEPHVVPSAAPIPVNSSQFVALSDFLQLRVEHIESLEYYKSFEELTLENGYSGWNGCSFVFYMDRPLLKIGQVTYRTF